MRHFKNWLQESTSWQIPVHEETGYGYLWWTVNSIDGRNALAMGFAGQYIVVLADVSSVIVATSRWQGLGGRGRAGDQQQAISRFMKEKIYPYLKEASEED